MSPGRMTTQPSRQGLFDLGCVDLVSSNMDTSFDGCRQFFIPVGSLQAVKQTKKLAHSWSSKTPHDDPHPVLERTESMLSGLEFLEFIVMSNSSTAKRKARSKLICLICTAIQTKPRIYTKALVAHCFLS